MELIKLAVVLILGYFILKFLWNTLKGFIKVVLAVVIIVAGVYFVKPDLLYNVFGKDKVENVANDIKEEADELVEEGKDFVEENADSAIDSVKKAAEDVTNQ